VRENYKVQLPALRDLHRFGIYISYDCRFYATYELIRDDDYVRGFAFSFLLISNYFMNYLMLLSFVTNHHSVCSVKTTDNVVLVNCGD